MNRNKSFQIKSKEYANASKFEMYFIRYFNRLQTLAMNRFEYKNVPDEIPPKFIEEILFWFGQGIFFKDDVLEKYAFMKNLNGGTIDNYGVPNMRFGYANQYIEHLPKEKSVIFWDNSTDYPIADYCYMYADSLANMRLTRDINIYAQRTPICFAGTNNQQLTVRNLFKQYNDFIPFISVKDGITNLDNLKALNIEAPVVFDKLQILMKQEISDFCTLIGIDSVDGSKKERLVANEAIGDADEAYINRMSALNMRKRACEQVNRIFGLDMNVEYVGGIVEDLKNETNVGNLGEVKNEDIANVNNNEDIIKGGSDEM